MKYRYTYSTIYRWCTYTVYYSCTKNSVLLGTVLCDALPCFFAAPVPLFRTRCYLPRSSVNGILEALRARPTGTWYIPVCVFTTTQKNVRSCSYMNLIWWHLGTRHIISKFKYDNLTKAWQYVVKKGPWVKQTEIHDDSCRWDVDPLLKPSIIQIGSNWINRPNKPASTVKWWFINSSPDLTSSYHWSVQLCFTSVGRKVKQFLKCASAHVSGLCIFEHST